MAIAIALPGFSGLGRSMAPTFLSRIRFYLQLSPRCAKMNKKVNVGRFLSMVRETVVAKYELVL